VRTERHALARVPRTGRVARMSSLFPGNTGAPRELVECTARVGTRSLAAHGLTSRRARLAESPSC